MAFDNRNFRYGSARIAHDAMIAQAGGFKWNDPHALFAGFAGGRPLVYCDRAGGVIVAGARAGKLATLIAMNLCRGCNFESKVILDVKNEAAEISRTIGHEGKHAIHWNPMRAANLPFVSINPCEHLTWDNPNLIDDINEFAGDAVEPSGGGNAVYFERRAIQFLYPLMWIIVEMDGVLTLPRLYHAVCALETGGERWLNQYGAFMQASVNPEIHDYAEIIERGLNDDNGAGFKGIVGELSKTVQGLKSPQVRQALSPPFGFSLADLCNPDFTTHLYLNIPDRYLESLALPIRCMFRGAMAQKMMKPSAPRQTYIIDEAAQLKAPNLIRKLYSVGAGQGVRPLTVWQSSAQLDQLGKGARQEILSSAGLQIYFGLRDPSSARELSDRLGYETLSYTDSAKQAEARLRHLQAQMEVIDGEDPVRAALEARHFGREAVRDSQISRKLRQPSELLFMPSDRMWVFMDNCPAPIYGTRIPYWKLPFMAGKYTGSSWYPPEDVVEIAGPRGPQKRRVITAPVDPRFAHLPQYQHGEWQYVEGFKP